MLGAQEVADRLGLSARTVKRFIKTGELEAYKFGKEYKVPEEAVTKFMANRKVA